MLALEGPSRRAKKHQDPSLPSLFNMKEGLSRAPSVWKNPTIISSTESSQVWVKEDEESSEQPETCEDEEIEEEKEDKSE